VAARNWAANSGPRYSTGSRGMVNLTSSVKQGDDAIDVRCLECPSSCSAAESDGRSRLSLPDPCCWRPSAAHAFERTGHRLPAGVQDPGGLGGWNASTSRGMRAVRWRAGKCRAVMKASEIDSRSSYRSDAA
jgi:hypothetical protein